MAFMAGLLMGLGRLSGDREAVALLACGVSPLPMLPPILVLAVIAGLGNLPFAAGEYAFGYRLQPTWLTATTTLYAALITTILAYVAWNTAVDIVGAPRASAFLHTIPLFSALLATTLLGERIEAYHVLGFALILGGVTLVARQPAQASGYRGQRGGDLAPQTRDRRP